MRARVEMASLVSPRMSAPRQKMMTKRGSAEESIVLQMNTVAMSHATYVLQLGATVHNKHAKHVGTKYAMLGMNAVALIVEFADLQVDHVPTFAMF